jgi:hypothetical protein
MFTVIHKSPNGTPIPNVELLDDEAVRKHCEETWPGCAFGFSYLKDIAPEAESEEDDGKMIVLLVLKDLEDDHEVGEIPILGTILAPKFLLGTVWHDASFFGELSDAMMSLEEGSFSASSPEGDDGDENGPSDEEDGEPEETDPEDDNGPTDAEIEDAEVEKDIERIEDPAP